MGRTFRVYLAGEKVLACKQCGNHLAVSEGVISEHFRGQHGTAWLVQQVVNTYTGDAEDREMSTGRHTVRDVFCRVCHTTLGWKYDYAFEYSQKYKEGKFILEKALFSEKPERRDIGLVPRIEEIPVRDIIAARV
ncbi:hypothetical protein L202_08312 [Cryptococcus amylolentus CBS 6039]|uniref:Protein yippee-like n=1 Tax=Cryptococcus amylolentus CBS 6039 TaxID=1295533 RepID=A0A1E3H979_9TREE|nr:hypothetical protein L202_08312 [Cryptococcus amylolentus CBS 6039]ODN72889.1 hypothetical protein L202_08312 [Cryptococcus amylolentus CBS 6039]